MTATEQILAALIAKVAMCWTPQPTGRFDAERAEMLLNEALKLLRETDDKEKEKTKEV